MAIGRRPSLGILICLSFCTSSSFAQLNCSSNTWVTIPSAWATYGSAAAAPVSGSSGCQSLCLQTPTCYGASWNPANSGCQLNLNASNAITYDYNATQQTSYYSLIRGYSNCASDMSCGYNWAGIANTHGSGATQININNVNDCVKSCQDNSACTALDWNAQDQQCWIYTSTVSQTAPQTYIYFFRKYCIATTSLNSSRTTPLRVLTQSSPTSQPAPSSSTSLPTQSAAAATTTTTTTTTATTTIATTTTTVISSSSPANSTGPMPMMSESDDVYGYATAIKPAYVVLAALGGGCLLLVITALIILCQYPLHGSAETYSRNGTLVHANGTTARQEEMNMEGGDNVEFNPYYNRSEVGAPDFTKEENLM